MAVEVNERKFQGVKSRSKYQYDGSLDWDQGRERESRTTLPSRISRRGSTLSLGFEKTGNKAAGRRWRVKVNGVRAFGSLDRASLRETFR